MNHKYVVVIGIILQICSCTNRERMFSKESKLAAVAIDDTFEKKAPTIEKNQLANNELGPVPYKNQTLTNNLKALPVNCLILGPALNRSVAYLSIFRELQKRKSKIHFVTGYGFSSIVASLYAMGLSADAIEWKLFKFYRELSNERPFSSDWMKVLERKLLNEFDNLSIEKLQTKLALPLWNKKGQKMEYITRGKLKPILMANLNLTKGRKKNNKYLNPLEGKIFMIDDFKKMGCDITFGADAIGGNISLVRGDDYLVGIFGKAATQAEDNKIAFDDFFQIEKIDFALDVNNNLANFMRMTLSYGLQSARAIEEKTLNWIESR